MALSVSIPQARDRREFRSGEPMEHRMRKGASCAVATRVVQA
jgi:hypothetical protein